MARIRRRRTVASFIRKIWQDQDIVEFEDANRWEEGILVAHEQIAALIQRVEELEKRVDDSDQEEDDDNGEFEVPITRAGEWIVGESRIGE